MFKFFQKYPDVPSCLITASLFTDHTANNNSVIKLKKKDLEFQINLLNSTVHGQKYA